ncbi:hypothetical protein J4450_03915 [Candidatus Micrarchaeota archaeon]|nr:hypothetical protein [Candidatus Micrarchaeota archaeon]
MLNKTNIATGAAMILGGAGEIIATGGAFCPLCIGAITSGTGIIANEFGLRINK